jgi:hypothetical protein
MKAAPQYAAQIDQFKRDGTSAAEANAWIIAKMAVEQPEAKGNTGYQAAARRDASVLAGLKGVATGSHMNVEESAFMAQLQKGGRIPNGNRSQ